MFVVRSVRRRASAARNLLVAVAALAALAILALLLLKPTAQNPAGPSSPAAVAAAPAAGSDAAPTAEVADAKPATDAVDDAVVAAAATPAPTPAPSPTPSGPINVYTGRVTATDGGAPIAGAKVSLAQQEGVWFMTVGKPPTLAATAETDEEGNYRIEHPADSIKSPAGAPVELTLLVVRADGFAEESAFAYGAVPAEGRKTDFELEAGGRVSGWVIDDTDNPVSGAIVGSMMLDAPDMSRMSESVQRVHSGWATTGGNGGFELSGVPAGTRIRIPARADGYMTNLSDEVEAGAKDVRIVLSKGGGTIVGEVLDAEDKPVADVMIAAMLQPEGGQEAAKIQEMLARMTGATSDAQGKFRLEHMTAGNWMLQASEEAKGGRKGRNANQSVQVAGEGETAVTLRFEKAVIFVGRAIDTATGQGLAGVKVGDEPYRNWVGGGMEDVPESKTRKEVVTGPDGKFRIEVASTGHGAQWVYYQAPTGWIAETGNGPSNDGMHYVQDARGGEETTVELRFAKGAMLSGRVTTRDGAPAVDCAVRVNSGTGGAMRSTKTKADGAYEIAVLPNATAKLYAQGKQGWAEAETEIPAKVETATLDIVLDAFASVSGRVTANGKPVADVSISVTRNLSWQQRGETKTDADGRYVVLDVPGGDVNVSLTLPSGSENYATPKPETLKLAAGEKRENVDFALGEGDMIEGVVSNEDGEAIEGANVSWNVYDGGPWRNSSTKTDAEGYYKITGLRENATVQNINVSHTDYQNEYRNQVTVLDGPQNFTLKRLGKVTLLAVDDANRPVPKYDYILGSVGDAGNRPTRVSNAEGKVSLSVSGDGDNRVSVAEIGEDGKATGRKGTTTFQAPKTGEPVDVVVKLDAKTYEISGIVLMQGTDAPVADALVAVYKDERDFGWNQNAIAGPNAFDVESVRTDSGGRFKLAGLMEGTYQLTATKDSLTPVERPRVVVSPTEKLDETTIRLAAQGVVYGQALDRNRKPIAGAAVQWYEQNPWRERKTTTDDEGRYRAEGLAKGSIWFNFNDQRSGLQEGKNAEVEPGTEVELNFDFSDTIKLTGVIRVNGAPWTGSEIYFSIVPENGSGANVVAKGDGLYESYPRAGAQKLSANSMTGGVGTAARFSLPAEPREQSMDFDVTTVPADIVVEVAEGATYARGYIQMRIEDGAGGWQDAGMHIQMDSARRHLAAIVPGRFKAIYRSYDGQVTGESDWTTVSVGGDNVFVVFAANAEQARAELRKIQEGLLALGFDPGPIDGLMGPRTSGALKKFQEANGLPATGEADGATKGKLAELGKL